MLLHFASLDGPGRPRERPDWGKCSVVRPWQGAPFCAPLLRRGALIHTDERAPALLRGSLRPGWRGMLWVSREALIPVPPYANGP